MTKLSYQLYSARNFPPLSAIFEKLGKAGYGEVEGFGGIYAELDEAGLKSLRADLDKNGLVMATGHFSPDFLDGNVEKSLQIAKVLGMDSIYAPHLMPDQRPTDAAGWLAFGKRLQEMSKPYKDAGYEFGWHNHDFEFVKLSDGSLPIERIFEGAPGITWEADIAWVVRGGADPYAWVEKLGDRISAVHVKDIAPAGEAADEGGWADVGHGTIGWAKLLPVVKAKTKAKHFVVEHDNPNDIDRNITRSIASFKTY
ncbi:sugar phosphate isomerase/epimerase [Rhizobium sp. BK275]|uniref:sugar phosphate isomerase/epimerase family protein n=1 Tax=unclassified Rhizobium TaxID=2613769 RepID=UPI00160DAE33|nr:MULTISPECIES: sugar phosphate isomerase/epimerase [unclassified Rhizobium]MBB3393087.1 sugar phosphate isomerase/epimerase [Rhizobium sp. BK275]MBB3409720.1 sugar phosphate isomerase/epimerase [Rhizobium sp. BK316]